MNRDRQGGQRVYFCLCVDRGVTQRDVNLNREQRNKGLCDRIKLSVSQPCDRRRITHPHFTTSTLPFFIHAAKEDHSWRTFLVPLFPCFCLPSCFAFTVAIRSANGCVSFVLIHMCTFPLPLSGHHQPFWGEEEVEREWERLRHWQKRPTRSASEPGWLFLD